jgi:oligopeptide transport system substrate-binding protein
MLNISPQTKRISRPQAELRALVVFALLGSLGLALSGCSNNPHPSGAAVKPILYGIIADDPKTLDPSIGYDVASGGVIDPIYPAYLSYHYLKRDPFVLQLNLGDAEPQSAPLPMTVSEKDKDGKEAKVTKTGQVWTFRIKKGLRFQDDPCFPGGKGREITAADFLYSFRRMADPAIACPIIQFFDDKVLGMQDFEKHQADLKKAGQKPDYSFPIEGLELDPNDPYTFRIKLNQPYPQLRYLMAMHFTSPLAHEAVEKYGKELARHPVGCGPYKLTEYRPKGGITLVANDNYRKDDFYPSEGAPGDREAGLLKDAGKQLPLVKEIHLNVVREGTTIWNMFLQGYTDIGGVGRTNFQQVMANNGQLSPEMKARGLGLHRDVEIAVSYFAFNMNDPVVGGVDANGKPLTGAEAEKHRKLRQAISCTMDAQKYIDIIYLGLGKQAQSVIPPGIFGYDPNYKNPYRQYPPDLDKAKRLLSEAGYPGGIDPKTGDRLTIFWDNYLTDAAGRQQVSMFKDMFEAIGIRIESRTWRYPVFQGKVDAGQYQMMNFGWVADYPDPENFDFLFYGPNKRPGPNACNYNNPEYDKLFEQMRSMNDGPERLAIINKLRDMIVEDCPWIYTIHSEAYSLTQPWLHNYKSHPVALDGVKYYNIDGPLRARLQTKWNQPNYLPLLAVAALIFLGSIPAARVVQQRTNRYVRQNRNEK